MPFEAFDTIRFATVDAIRNQLKVVLMNRYTVCNL